MVIKASLVNLFACVYDLVMIVNHEKLIILDFDHTIFNTTLYVDDLVKKFESDFGISREEFLKQRNAVKDCCAVIDIDNFVLRLSNDDKEGMHQALHDVIKDNAKRFTYDDAAPFIDAHKDNFDIMLLTHGNQELQTEKITHSGLPEGLSFVVTTEDKSKVISDYVGKYKVVYFVDDKAENIRLVEEAFPEVETYFMKRPGDQPYGGGFDNCEEADFVVSDLTFVIES